VDCSDRPWDSDAGSGECLPAHNPSPNCVAYGNQGGHHLVGNDPHDTSVEATSAFQRDWIAHLQATFGAAANGGVRYYALDNEVMLWSSTHRDVHPAPTTYDETWNKALDYGGAIKQQDPAALVGGPVTWGYCDLFGSAADDCVNGSDRVAHGGMPFVAWYLQQVCAHPLAGGARAVDVLDLHYYPPGSNIALDDDDSAATAARRLRSLKELYRQDWVSESWISDLGDADANHYSKPNLIPRVRAWIAQYCPGTRLAITEYNWGNDGTTSGAVAQAELFGIFAREGVDMATRWVAPEPDTKAERAFTLFLNYDGAGAKVQGDSVRATSGNVDQIGAYAFRRHAHDGAAHQQDDDRAERRAELRERAAGGVDAVRFRCDARGARDRQRYARRHVVEPLCAAGDVGEPARGDRQRCDFQERLRIGRPREAQPAALLQ
jgi:hypothetical protein